MCAENKCALCTFYSIHAVSLLPTFCSPYNYCIFTLSGPTHFARIRKIMTRQTINVCKCYE